MKDPSQLTLHQYRHGMGVLIVAGMVADIAGVNRVRFNDPLVAKVLSPSGTVDILEHTLHLSFSTNFLPPSATVFQSTHDIDIPCQNHAAIS